jgi:hypothetical protein
VGSSEGAVVGTVVGSVVRAWVGRPVGGCHARGRGSAALVLRARGRDDHGEAGGGLRTPMEVVVTLSLGRLQPKVIIITTIVIIIIIMIIIKALALD